MITGKEIKKDEYIAIMNLDTTNYICDKSARNKIIEAYWNNKKEVNVLYNNKLAEIRLIEVKRIEATPTIMVRVEYLNA